MPQLTDLRAWQRLVTREAWLQDVIVDGRSSRGLVAKAQSQRHHLSPLPDRTS